MTKPSNKLDAATVKNAVAEKEEWLADGNGLWLRVRHGGAKTFVYRYQLDGKAIKLVLGSYPALSLKAARAARDACSVLRTNGIDPKAQRAREALEETAKGMAAAESIRQAEETQRRAAERLTFGQLFERWFGAEITQRKEQQQALLLAGWRKDILPKLADRPVETITRADVAMVLDDILQRGAKRVTNMRLAELRQMFGFAIARGLLDNDPTMRMKKTDFGGIEAERDRALNESELIALARQAQASGLSEQAQAAMWLLLATCARVNELCRARWEHVDFDKQEWLIPAEHSKNGKQHIVHLSDFAVQQFEKLRDWRPVNTKSAARWRQVVWVMPNRERDGPVCPKSLTVQLRDRQKATATTRTNGATGVGRGKRGAEAQEGARIALQGGAFVVHDLRRTGATMLGRLGVAVHVIERCLKTING